MMQSVDVPPDLFDIIYSNQQDQKHFKVVCVNNSSSESLLNENLPTITYIVLIQNIIDYALIDIKNENE